MTRPSIQLPFLSVKSSVIGPSPGESATCLDHLQVGLARQLHGGPCSPPSSAGQSVRNGHGASVLAPARPERLDLYSRERKGALLISDERLLMTPAGRRETRSAAPRFFCSPAPSDGSETGSKWLSEVVSTWAERVSAIEGPSRGQQYPVGRNPLPLSWNRPLSSLRVLGSGPALPRIKASRISPQRCRVRLPSVVLEFLKQVVGHIVQTHNASTLTPRMGRPSRLVTRPAIGTSSVRSGIVSLCRVSSGETRTHPGPNPGAIAPMTRFSPG